MKLRDRIKVIITEQNLKQKDFASSIKVSESYVSNLLSGKRESISESLASLIQGLYGYSAHWILTGEGDAHIPSNSVTSPLRARILADIENLTEAEAKAVLAFLDTLKTYQIDNSDAPAE